MHYNLSFWMLIKSATNSYNQPIGEVQYINKHLPLKQSSFSSGSKSNLKTGAKPAHDLLLLKTTNLSRWKLFNMYEIKLVLPNLNSIT